MERGHLIVEMVTINRNKVPYESSVENCISEKRDAVYDAKNLFDNDWNIHRRINKGTQTKTPGQLWVAVDFGKTYFLQMVYLQGRVDGNSPDRINGVRFHFCLEFRRPKEIDVNTFEIDESMCPLCGEMNDIIFRRKSTH